MAFKNQKKKPLRLLRIDIDKRILKDIDYKNPLVLGKFLSSRYKVLGRTRTSIPAKIQRKLSKEVKKARIMALLPFTEGHQI